MADVLVLNACVVTGAGAVIPEGFVRASGGKIIQIGKGLPPKADGGDSVVIDAGGRYLLPGFINSHTHLYSHLARGISCGRARAFRDVLESLWWKLDRALSLDDIYVSAMLGCIDAIKSGVTTVIDHHASYGAIPGSLGAVSQAICDAGVRGSTCFEISDRAGKKARDEVIEEADLWLDGVKKKAEKNPDLLIRGMVGLHASMTLEDETLDAAIHLMDKFDVGAHVHVAEGIEDVKESVKKFGLTPVARFAKAGVFRQDSLAVHCVHLTKKDISMLARSGAYVVHNPFSNLNNAVGVAPVLAMHEKGIPVAIGTDGMSAGIADDIRLASVLHKPGARDAQAAWDETKSSVWQVAPRIVSKMFDCGVGVLKKGCAADLIVVDAIPPTSVTAENAWGHVLFGVLNARVRDSIIAGRVRMKDFIVAGVDETALAKKAQRLSKKLWQRI